MFLSSLVWHCCIWSWVKERGCKAPTPTVNSWTTIDGKQLLSPIVITTPPSVLSCLHVFCFSHPLHFFKYLLLRRPGLNWCFQWRGSCSAFPPHPSPLPSSPLPTCSPSCRATSIGRGWSCCRTSYSELHQHTHWHIAALFLQSIVMNSLCLRYLCVVKHRSCQDIPGAAFIVENKNWRFVLCLCFAGSLLWPGRSHKRHQHIPLPTRCRPFFLCVSEACMCVRACSRGESMVDNFNPAESLVTFVFLCV